MNTNISKILLSGRGKNGIIAGRCYQLMEIIKGLNYDYVTIDFKKSDTFKGMHFKRYTPTFKVKDTIIYTEFKDEHVRLYIDFKGYHATIFHLNKSCDNNELIGRMEVLTDLHNGKL